MSPVQVLNSLCPRRPSVRRRVGGALIVAAGAGVALACGGDSGGTGTTPDYSLSLSSAALSINQGAIIPPPSPLP